MKRYISLVLVAVVLVGLLAVPSYAAETGNDFAYYDLLEYGYILGKDSNTFTCDLTTNITYSLPQRSVVNYVDLYVNSSYKPSVSALDNSGSWWGLSVDHVTANIYHIYGSVKPVYYSELTLKFSCPWTSYLDIYRFYAYSVLDTSVELSGNAGVSASGLSNYVGLDFSPGNPSSVTWSSSFTPGSNYYNFSITSDGWRHFDYVDVCVVIDTSTIDSINCTYDDGKLIPITVNPVMLEGSTGSAQFVDIRLDFTGFNPSSSDDPILSISGSENVGDYSNYVQIWSAVGFVSLDPVSTDTFFLRNIWNSIKSGFNSVVSSITASGNSIISSISSVGSKIETWGQNIVDAIVGDDTQNEVISDALHTQEDVNEQINVQLGSAISDWDGNITVVSGGYDSAVLSAAPALQFLGNLAQGVFSGMGWFGTMFFFIGFVNVFFLFMNKTGLGSKVRSMASRESPPGK